SALPTMAVASNVSLDMSNPTALRMGLPLYIASLRRGAIYKVWQFVEDALRAVVPADSFEPTAQKLKLFKVGAATILFYEDQNVVKGLQEQFPAYAANFPVWADQANAMVQYAVWTTLAAVGAGANLQHYNPLPDVAIAKAWNIPENWLLRAQMVIGGIEGAAGEKVFEPVAERLKVFGA
ncbi:TPA: nitroreductase family protein, partial [Neisseria gonorrhoeae]